MQAAPFGAPLSALNQVISYLPVLLAKPVGPRLLPQSRALAVRVCRCSVLYSHHNALSMGIARFAQGTLRRSQPSQPEVQLLFRF